MDAWGTIPETEYALRTWDGEIVVYHRGSGDTHLLNPLASQIFEWLRERPATLSGLADQIAQSLGVAADPALRNDLEDTLQRLGDFGLIGPRP